MKKIIKIAILLICFSPLYLISAEQDVKNELNQIEAQRTQEIEEQLLLNLPEISDNPNHIITFKDPSGKGVSLEIDGQGFEKINSPYTLPSLGLGKHILTFKFSDEENTKQILERSFTIIPRPPVINPPTIEDKQITISGTAISNSKVDLFLSREISNQQILTEVNQNGNWEYTFVDDIEEGIYTIMATTRKNGFASYYSEPIVFTVGNDTAIVTSTENIQQGVDFNFKDIDFSNYKNIFKILKTNTDLAISLGIFFILGALFTWILSSLIHRITQKKSKKVLQDLLRKKTSSDAIPFKEKFENSKKVKQEDIVEEKVEVKNEDEKIEEKIAEETQSLTKNEFLEKFKDFDPDDEEGDEKDLKKKKRIKISLTSKD